MIEQRTKIDLAAYKETLNQPLRQVSLCFLVRDEKVLLGWKNRGFGKDRQAGKDKWNGAGGKLKPEETIEQCAIREVEEEFGVTPIALAQVATINFYFPHVQQEENWNQQVCVFLVTDWQGTPRPAEEMTKIKWFKFDQIPFDQMWAADRHWLPPVLAGEKLSAEIMFGDQEQIITHEIRIGENENLQN